MPLNVVMPTASPAASAVFIETLAQLVAGRLSADGCVLPLGTVVRAVLIPRVLPIVCLFLPNAMPPPIGRYATCYLSAVDS